MSLFHFKQKICIYNHTKEEVLSSSEKESSLIDATDQVQCGNSLGKLYFLIFWLEIFIYDISLNRSCSLQVLPENIQQKQ